MSKYKILNLYACLGGNRYKWDEVADIEVTAVELDPQLAIMYQERFPNDNVIVDDAHQYLLDHYQEFDFVWSSPPCPSHSRARFWNTKAHRIYPDMSLYQQVLFLQTHFKGKFCVENVVPYYEPLIPAKKIGRHLFWANFLIGEIKVDKDEVLTKSGANDELVKKYKGKQKKDKIARNLVNPEIGRYILARAIGILSSNNTPQTSLFEL
jgi:DNA (cytosine-5)-methyltransferase 1